MCVGVCFYTVPSGVYWDNCFFSELLHLSSASLFMLLEKTFCVLFDCGVICQWICVYGCLCVCVCVCVCVPTPRVHPSLKMDSVYACILACDKYCCSEHRCVGVFSDDISSMQSPSIAKARYCGSSCLLFEGSSLLFCVLAVPSWHYRKQMCDRLVFRGPLQHLLSVVFLLMTVLSGGRWYLIVLIAVLYSLAIWSLFPVLSIKKKKTTFMCLKVTSWNCLLETSLCFDMLSNYQPQHIA